MTSLLLAKVDASAFGQVFGYMIVYFPLFALVAFFGASIAKLFTPGRSAGWIAGTILSGILTVCLLFAASILTFQKLAGGKIGGAGAPTGSAGSKSTPSSKVKAPERLVSTDGVVSIQLPEGWKSMPDLVTNTYLGAGNSSKEEYFLVVQTPKIDFEGSLEDFAEGSAKRTMAKMEKGEMTSLGTNPLNGFPVIRKRFDGRVNNLNLVYYNAYIETKDSFYFVMGWTTKSQDAIGYPVLKEALESFQSKDGPPEEPAEAAPKGSPVPPQEKTEPK